MAEPLSPAAQAVLDAWLSSERDPACLAADLRAAAAHMEFLDDYTQLHYIANELEGARWGRPAAPPAPEPLPIIRYEFLIKHADEPEASGDFPTLEEAAREGRPYLSAHGQVWPLTLEIRRVEVLSVVGAVGAVGEGQPAPAPAEPPL